MIIDFILNTLFLIIMMHSRSPSMVARFQVAQLITLQVLHIVAPIPRLYLPHLVNT